MNTSQSIKDISGKSVFIGSKVKILSLSKNDFAHLSEQEFFNISSLFIGKIFAVVDIDEYGQAWVTHDTETSPGEYSSDSIGLSSTEMELQ